MKANLIQLRKNRKYYDEFKKEIVSLFQKGKLSINQLGKLYDVSNVTI
jgi:transposase-like protein